MKKTINGLSVYLSGNNESKTILFVHGFPFDHTMWQTQVDEFSKDYLCISYDIRGLGESPASDGQFTMESFVDDLETILDELKLNRPILCGLSMGGYISLRALERMQERFSAAILCDTRSEADNNEGKLKRVAGIKRINKEGLATFAKDFITNCFGDDFKQNRKEELQKIIEKSSQFNPVGVKGCLLAMVSRTDTTDNLSKIKNPTLVICGSEDKLSPPDVMKSMADKIPNANFVLVEGSGHMTPIEKPKVVTEECRKFLINNQQTNSH